jgi:uncharacterized protein (DUF305 family)
MRLSSLALLLALVLIAAGCGESGSGGGEPGSRSGDSSASGDTAKDKTTETAGNGATSGTSGMGAMEDMGSEEMARQMLTRGGAYSDENFIDQMVPHHQGAIREARVAADNAEHEELQNLAEGIIADQRIEIQRMKDIREEEYGSRGSQRQMPREEGEMMGMMDDPEALADQDPFDRAFMNNMIPHHRSAIAMAEIALQESENPEIRQLAQNIVDSQQSEIEQMQGWLEEWYPQS